jgi:SAM-dependent methyltransferase
MLTQEFWDARYHSAERIWSGNPNPHLVAQVADLAPGSALDVGSGEGADAIWLATRAWQVTGIDLSTVALERAAQLAAWAGQDIAERITWEQADVLSWDPAPRQFDLVSAQFMHLPRLAREALHLRLAAAVRPGGMLLIAGHHPSDLDINGPAQLARLLLHRGRARRCTVAPRSGRVRATIPWLISIISRLCRSPTSRLRRAPSADADLTAPRSPSNRPSSDRAWSGISIADTSFSRPVVATSA